MDARVSLGPALPLKILTPLPLRFRSAFQLLLLPLADSAKILKNHYWQPMRILLLCLVSFDYFIIFSQLIPERPAPLK